MIKTILVPLSGSDADVATLGAAFDLSRRFGAHVTALHVRIDPADIAASVSADGGGALMTGRLIDEIEAEAVERAERAEATLREVCSKAGVTIAAAEAEAAPGNLSFHVETGREAEWVAEYGRAAELVVMPRPADGIGAALDTVEGALIDSGRPLFIPASRPLAPETVAVAWKSTREAARALTAALPFLGLAKRAVVLHAIEGDRGESGGVARVVASLRRHGLTVENRIVEVGREGAGEALLAAAEAAGAGLLVMGGYGHSRLREWVLGGVTEHVLRAARIPVLMSH